MCGIGGFVDFDRDARRGGPVLMDRRLRPRGPDASGVYTDPDAALVHRRLIVIDPEGGAQPMLSPDGNTVLVYNGELYNTDEVRDSLAALGHVFRSRSDTEVVLHAFLEWDTDAFARLDGIFALAEGRAAARPRARPSGRQAAVLLSDAQRPCVRLDHRHRALPPGSRAGAR